MTVKTIPSMILLTIAKIVLSENNLFQQSLNVMFATLENTKIPTPLQMPVVCHVLVVTF